VNVYVRLRIASESFAISVEHVLQVAHLDQVTVVPGAPPAMLGVWNLRGQILPVVDLAHMLRIPRPVSPSRLLVAEAGDQQAAFAIDDVSGVGELADPTEETESDLLAGATLADGDLIGVIDVTRVFDSLAGTRP
jgi:chemotaxis signal transduction protein